MARRDEGHTGVDEGSGLVHHAECTAAGAAQVHALLHGGNDTVNGRSGYAGVEERAQMEAVKARLLIAEKHSTVKAIRNKLDRKRAERRGHTKASLRALLEHPFRVVKQQFGFGMAFHGRRCSEWTRRARERLQPRPCVRCDARTLIRCSASVVRPGAPAAATKTDHAPMQLARTDEACCWNTV
ncbi:hypothetical protein HNQ52_002830 [Chiayiivirga flava]|uniref:Transposase IS4-like domain-containing protein n=1 Tax=Chiayiivirga flava TaxID=659595 RepID=A0A7W8D9I6_9GAMM|nr:hypothetical protein [Chiayiivirga flava]